MSIGERKQIKLVQITPSIGAEGNWNAETKTSFNTWAEVSGVNQFRDYQAGQVGMGQTKRFKVRFRFDQYPGADWMVEYASKDWVVSSVVKENERAFYWIITAQSK